ncbi:hypothetical protein BpHYR1_042347 [Brachionus plicatilis]|uniref:Uncharacterized protein n=1 Tax=Brachionus plicatilis TaxID=10195 RepID=A0A3M7SUH5_BRAPC|nr:hypothetical protein BpHYR1_042347 [Brachionus plicatilis]
MSVTTDLDGVLTRTVDANNSHKNVLTPPIKWREIFLVGSKKSGEKISGEFSIIQKWGFFNFTLKLDV